MDKIAVLIPCYNESMTIEKVITDFKKSLPDAVVYVYDNNSADNTALLAAQAGAIVRHEYQQGKGNVVRRMFQEVNAHCYILIASGFLLIAALQLMGIGITLQTIKKKNRQDFEIDLYRVMEQEKE